MVIPEERLPKGKKVAFTCPDCKATIKLDLTGTAKQEWTAPSQEPKPLLAGEKLKKKILRTVHDLPPMPRTVVKAREIMADPKKGFKDLAKIFEGDQAIAARILKLANSSYYGMSGKVSSIQRASVVLGHKTLGELITLSGASTLLGNRLEGYGLDAGDLWKHSLAVAFGSRFVAEKTDPELINDAFTCGLLHDAGKLVLDRYIVERWESFEQFISDGQRTFLDAEKEIFQLDHAEIASEICRNWHIPDHLAHAIRYHHHPLQSQDSKLSYIVHVADATALMSGLGTGIDSTLYNMEEDALAYLGLKEEDLNDLMDGIFEFVKKISDK